MEVLKIGQSHAIKSGANVAILNFGPLLDTAQAVAEKRGYTLVDMRFAKPLDHQVINDISQTHQLIVTIEDHSIIGGAGSAVSEYLHTNKIQTDLLVLGIPDNWISHATRSQQLAECGLDQVGIESAIEKHLSSS